MTSATTASQFSIVDWAAWQPGVLSHEQWQNWQSQGVTEVSEQLPDFSAIPPMLRRRLPKLGRVAVSLMGGLVDAHGALPIVYASQHCELHRTTGILDDIAAGNPVSPAAFSMAVHNSMVGVFSIHKGITSNITAIAAGTQGLVPVLLEAVGLLADGHDQVLCVMCDEPVPSRYAGYEPHPAMPYALAFVLAAGNRHSLCCQPGGASDNANASDNDQDQDQDDTPQALTLIRYLLSESKGLHLSHNRSGWLIEKTE
ncbi:MAG: beta-ketoacyl synthase chain length factor [Pseudomonadales bacterium]